MRIPSTAPDWENLFSEIIHDPERMRRALRTPTSQTETYLHWDDLRHRQPPTDLTRQEWWFALKISRQQAARPLSGLTDISGRPFWYSLPDIVLRLTDEITRKASGQIAADSPLDNRQTRDRYIVSSLMEEAITSSQLEGAVTTRVDAKNMLRAGRAPRDLSEQMIVNNYRAMQFIVEMRDQQLTPDLVKEIHRIVTENTLRHPDAAGRIQGPEDERVALWDDRDAQIVHQPPPASQLHERLSRLCDFANNADGQDYMPPLLRALTVHFMMGYDHYFEDGNGRTARAVFYWSMLHEGFWLTEFLTVSRLLKKAPAAYSRSFLYTETDDGDLTYFFVYHLKILQRAIDDLHIHLAQKTAEMHFAQQRLHALPDQFNHRQIAVLQHALRNPGFSYTASSHSASHRISLQTARADLNGLAAAGYLIPGKHGRAAVWTASTQLSSLLRPDKL